MGDLHRYPSRLGALQVGARVVDFCWTRRGERPDRLELSIAQERPGVLCKRRDTKQGGNCKAKE
ncbi:hypothetical protein HT585_27250 [Ensifer sp. HO-A22]|uniref:Uncharacterized protein n=1 Tax=Ensifer oleiphilus TaxID=2742698 RepID=A0A7Y6UQS2_9HYPH|nr:hypothetical protein [Ensifer oleiphilus]NVD42572.1 hypothetical protein [Ensifer oleiphilus]